MSVKERAEDARILYQAQRPQGALLSVLVAVAATSRKRQPRPIRDSEAFIKFVGDEMLVITGGGVLNYLIRFRGNDMRLEEFFYKCLRCELAHEGKLPDDVRFVKESSPGSLSTEVTDTYIALSHTWLDGLLKAVRFAPENAAEFPDVAEIPEDVAKWMLFGKQRAGPHVSDYWRARQHFAHAWASQEGQVEARDLPQGASRC